MTSQAGMTFISLLPLIFGVVIALGLGTFIVLMIRALK
jgi:hypothetical protein